MNAKKIISMSLCGVFLIHSTVFANESIRIQSNETVPVMILDNVDIEGSTKTFDEERGVYVFTLEDDSVAVNSSNDTSKIEINNFEIGEAEQIGEYQNKNDAPTQETTGGAETELYGEEIVKKIAIVKMDIWDKLYFLTKIMINESEMTQPSEMLEATNRTIKHEFGHVFALGYPDILCKYISLMKPSGSGDSNLQSNVPTLHDMYQVYTSYENGSSRSEDIKTAQVNDLTAGMTVETFGEFSQPIESIADIENTADYIVKGKIQAGSQNILIEYGGHTISDFEISDVYKGDINIGNIIPIREPYYTDKFGVIYRREAYADSKEDTEYILYLVKRESGLYYVVCASLGRYSLDDTGMDELSTDRYEAFSNLFKKLKAEVQELYK